jgi:hypothetical protein
VQSGPVGIIGEAACPARQGVPAITDWRQAITQYRFDALQASQKFVAHPCLLLP